jgi:predicted ATPase
MNEKIIIENFGGLKSVEFEYRPINILIGPQASGKSLAVKLTYFFKTFFSEIFKSIDHGETKRQLDSRQKEKFNNYFPKESWAKGSFKVEYQINKTFIQVEKKGAKPLVFNYSNDIKKIINKGKTIYKDEQKKVAQETSRLSTYKASRSARLRFNECVSKEVSDLANYTQYFVPAGRSFFANIQSGIFSFLSDNRSLDPFLIEFGSFYENFKRFVFDMGNDKKKKKEDAFDKLIFEIMNGTYLREKDKDYLIHSDGRKVNLSNASSGQQETLPLVLILKALTSLRFPNSGGATLYIEEPEAHLFPNAQKRMVELLARTFNTIDSNFQIIVTTHSPYILSSFNNLIEAGKVLQDNPSIASEIFKIVPEQEFLRPEDLIAYSLSEGEKKILIDKTTKLISQNILDSVSDEIASEFGELLDLEYYSTHET